MDGLDIPGCTELELIGQGGFAHVYRAREESFDRNVAVKVLNSTGDALDDETRDRFLRECRAIGGLSWHPNVVVVHRAGVTASGRLYLVMEYLPNGSLSTRVAAHGPFAWVEVLAIGVQLCGALAAAHRAGRIHRDVSPGNVLIGHGGEPRLADFGISAVAGLTVTRTGFSAFNLSHAAPEVLEGESAGEAADVYGLGSTLFTLLSAHPPFHREGDSWKSAIARIFSAPVPDLRPNGIPDDVCAVIERALGRTPSDRPSSAAVLGGLLQAVQRAHSTPITRLLITPGSAAPGSAAPLPVGDVPPPALEQKYVLQIEGLVAIEVQGPGDPALGRAVTNGAAFHLHDPGDPAVHLHAAPAGRRRKGWHLQYRDGHRPLTLRCATELSDTHLGEVLQSYVNEDDQWLFLPFLGRYYLSTDTEDTIEVSGERDAAIPRTLKLVETGDRQFAIISDRAYADTFAQALFEPAGGWLAEVRFFGAEHYESEPPSRAVVERIFQLFVTRDPKLWDVVDWLPRTD